MKKLYLTLTLLILASLACYSQTHVVAMVDNEFEPANITIQEGDTVLWVNDGSNVHTTTSGENCTSDGIWDSGNLSSNEEFEFVFDSAGDYPYFCIPHCGLGMTGSVTVEQTSPSISTLSEEVKIFPNPVVDRLQIIMPDRRDSDVKFMIMDSKGNRVSVEFENQLIPNTELDLSALPSGIYFIHLMQGDDNYSIKRILKIDQ